MSDSDIIESITSATDSNEENIATSSVVQEETHIQPNISKQEAIRAVNTLRLALQQKENVPQELFMSLNQAEDLLNK